MSGNPFDPYAAPAPAAAPPAPQYQYGAPPMQAPGYGGPSPGEMNSMASHGSVLSAQTPQAQQYPPQQQQAAYGQSFGMQQSPTGYSAYAQQPPATQNYQQPQQEYPAHPENGNPFGAAAPAPDRMTDYTQQALVPAQQPVSQWGIPAPAPAPPAYAGFDPFSAAPPPVPVPAPAPPEDPYAYDSLIPGIPGELVPNAPAPEPAPVPEPTVQQKEPSNSNYDQPGYSNAIVPRNEELSKPSVSQQVRNPYSQEIARRSGTPSSSPLPKAELVRKTGFVLGRISFRTIVMKKWKQCFWVQYGSHTMLWFRSKSDFDDWLNNPYHSQAQRNFLIKLAVNFVHDLYKPNVRGYQVTQCRSKPYGNKMIRQFKLERWMDYGPTIAAAFGSSDPKEVDELREAIVECMRNTPLDGGIRATGAVRQHHEQQHHHQEGQGMNGGDHGQKPYSESGFTNGGNDYSSRSAYSQPTQNGYSGNDQSSQQAGERSVATADLLDDTSYGAGALVPATNASYAYPGAPPNPAPTQSSYAQPQPPAYEAYPPAPVPPAYQQPPPQEAYRQPPPQQNYQPPSQQAYQQPPPQQQYGYGQQYPTQTF